MSKRSSPAPLVIRADASPDIGTGHVMRCLAIAQTWQAEGGTVHVIGQMTSGLEERLETEGGAVQEVDSTPGCESDALETAQMARERGATWCVIDGYHFDGLYQRRLREEGVRVLVLDDYGHADRYEADLVVNQNIDAEASLYRNRAEHTDLLLGPRFALLRGEFWPWRESRRSLQSEAHRVLVTLGGADPENCTEKVVDALGQLEREGLQCTVVVGGSNPHTSSIRTAAERADVSIDLRSNVSNMAALMAEHDIAASAGGSTCWELAFMGIPNVILVLADNQRGIAEGLDDEGTALNLGWHEEVDRGDLARAIDTLLSNDDRRIEMAKTAMRLVDGCGSDRVVSQMNGRLFLRPVQKADCEIIWRWANDPTVRERSYEEDPIPWEEHKEWFSQKLSDPFSMIFLGEDEDGPVGQVRFDVEDGVAVISVVVASEKRGRGYGTALITQGTERCLRTQDADRVDAYIKKTNEASIRAFKKAGYRLREEGTVEGESSYRFSKHRYHEQ